MSDAECLPGKRPCRNPSPFASREPAWLAGSDLARIVVTTDFQMVWGVLLGFMPETRATIDPGFVPSAEPLGQAPADPDAIIEIAAFDSSFTRVWSGDPAVDEALVRRFPRTEIAGDDRQGRRRPATRPRREAAAVRVS